MKTGRRKWYTRWIAVCVAIVLGVGICEGLTVCAAYENTHTNTGNQRIDIVEVAKTQIGYHEGSLEGTTSGSNNYTKYNVWNGKISGYGSNGYGYAWCHAFVSWCANQAGIGTDIIPKTAGTSTGRSFFVNQGTYRQSAANGGNYVPQSGDIIYYGSGSSPSHVGIVSSCDGGTVYTIEGNYSNKVGTRAISLSNSYIIGYGVPNYRGNSNPQPPYNISIRADRTTITAGESITFTYTIENSTDSCIGIDKDGSRFDTIGISGTSGSISYTFSQPGVYCVITAGSNPYGSACCDGVWIKVNERGAPFNISIQADKTTIIAGESISFSYTIENSTDSCIGIDKDGSRFDTIGVSGTSGTVSYTFPQPGVYCVITAGSNPYGSACCDGIWIKVNEKTAPFNISIQADRTEIAMGESITFTYTIENSTDSCIGIDKDGSRFDTINVSGTSGSISYTFSQPGVYCVITAGSNPYGAACCDGVWIKVKPLPGDLNSDNKITSDDLFLLQSYLTNNITLTESQGKAADLNEDGLADGFDLALLRQKLA
ncbi:CHAP domain-containing protein [uncultured Ruminococcus sp.]|uniref:CHAP domain-containing protein n=1 Tax=uncultured Ruminococcus sp. TaxID=165186 RepID=UPI0025F0BD53|nr:CHAP domain-containing protein [uncultured Ruminococcus sp.]